MNVKLNTLELGQVYTVIYKTKHMVAYPSIKCKLIKVTAKGYNLLHINTNKCIMKRHLYPSKYPEHKGSLTFFLPYRFDIY